MEKLQLSINKRIEVLWGQEVFKSNVQDVNEDNVAISIPTKNGEFIPLNKGQEIELLYYDKDVVYKFTSSVIGRKVEGVHVIIISLPNNYEIVQRRIFFRVSNIKYISYSSLKAPRKNRIPNNEELPRLMAQNENVKKGILIDISGGGVRLKIDETINLGDIVIIDLDINDERIYLKGEIVRIEQDTDKKNICGVNFIDLDNKVREKIVKYTFELMRSQRRRVLKED